MPDSSGIGQFARAMVQALGATAPPGDRVLALRGTTPLGLASTAIEEHELPAGTELWMQLGLSAELVRLRATVYHTPLFVAPIACEVPVVITLHDAIPVTHPELTTPEFMAIWQRWLGPSLRVAAHVVTVSEAARADLVTQALVSKDRVSVVHQAISSNFYPRPETAVVKRFLPYDLTTDSYVLYLGSIEPRKNIANLLAAFLRIAREHPEITLVLAGRATVQHETLASVLRAATETGRVRMVGAVSDQHAAELMAGARACAFLSRAEGFGRPVLEAMASGTPVLASRIAPHLELAGDAALFADPDNVEGIAQQLGKLLRDEETRAVLRERGLACAAEFTPARFAADLRAVYARVVGA